MNNLFRNFARAAMGGTLLFLAGCTSFSPDGGIAQVSDLAKERTGHAVSWQRSAAEADSAGARVAELLEKPLTPDSAVELALLNNRGLQASFSEVGIAEADFVQAGRLRNPLLSFGRLGGGGGVEIDRAIMFDVLGLLSMPAALQIGQQRFEQAQYQAASEVVGVAADVRRAYFNAVAAEELVKYQLQVRDAADASNELAARMLQAGNFNKLDRMREQAFHADATSQLAKAKRQAVSEREKLTRLLGLWGSQTGFALPDRLPALPKEAAQPKDVEQLAMDKRLDVQMARRAVEATSKSLGLTQATRFVNALELGYQNKSQTGEARESGYEIALELPLFDFGSTRNARAEATYMQAVHRAAEVAVNARSEVREAYAVYRTSYELARHYRDEVVPLRQRMSEENLLRYNGMLIGVFELLADAREQISSVTGAVEALRDHWLAETDLQTALTGRSPSAGESSRPSPTASAANGAAVH